MFGHKIDLDLFLDENESTDVHCDHPVMSDLDSQICPQRPSDKQFIPENVLQQNNNHTVFNLDISSQTLAARPFKAYDSMYHTSSSQVTFKQW